MVIGILPAENCAVVLTQKQMRRDIETLCPDASNIVLDTGSEACKIAWTRTGEEQALERGRVKALGKLPAQAADRRLQMVEEETGYHRERRGPSRCKSSRPRYTAQSGAQPLKDCVADGACTPEASRVFKCG